MDCQLAGLVAEGPRATYFEVAFDAGDFVVGQAVELIDELVDLVIVRCGPFGGKGRGASNCGSSWSQFHTASEPMKEDAVRQGEFAAASEVSQAADRQRDTLYSKRGMAPIVAGTAIGTAALTVGRGALGAVGNGLSFAAELVRATTGAASNSGESEVREAVAAKAAMKQRSDDLRLRIEQQLAAAGIQLTEPVELISNGAGGIAVAGSHPQQAAIEKALASDVMLEWEFNQLAGDYGELVEAGRAGELPPVLTITVPKSV